MDAKKYVRSLADDEGMTDGIADAEAKALLAWAKTAVKVAVAPLKDDAAAQKATRKVAERARGVAKVLESLCYDEEPAEAAKRWAALGHKEKLDGLPVDDPVATVKRLLAMEKAAKNA